MVDVEQCLGDLAEHLDALFAPERGELAELLGRDLGHWRAQVLTSR